MRKLVMAIAVGTLASGCVDPICSTIALAGLHVDVRDPGGAAVVDAEVIATDGDYRETLVAFDGQYQGAYERAGVYAITATRAGFAPATVTGVDVQDGSCHVEPAHAVITFAR